MKDAGDRKRLCLHDLLVVKRELEAEKATLAEKEKAAAAEVCVAWHGASTSGRVLSLRLVGRVSSVLTNFLESISVQGSKVPLKDPACLSVSGVYFICPLTGAMLTKSEREAHIKEAILMVGL